MRRALVIAVQVAAAVLVGLAVRELWLATRGDDGVPASPESAISVTASVTPDVVPFGTPVVASADVVADARIVRPETIRLQVDFDPYEPAGEPTVERSVSGDTAHVVFRFPLRCLKEGCEPAEARGVAQFEPGLLRYRFRDSAGNVTPRDIVDWPPIEVASRVSPVDVEQIRWRASETELSPVTTRFGPTGLAIVLLLGAAVLAGAAVWLARRLWHVPAAPEASEPAVQRPPLERALELARAELGNGVSAADRRRALELVARELSALGLHGLADEARSLAWSPRLSTAEEIASLARRAEDAAPRAVAAA